MPRGPAGRRAPGRSIAYSRSFCVELVDGVRGVGAVGGDGALHARRGGPFQISSSRSRGPHEEDEALLRRATGLKTATASGSSKPVRIVEVGVLAELEVGVGVARRLAGAGDDGEGITHRLRETAPALEERGQVRGHRSGSPRCSRSATCFWAASTLAWPRRPSARCGGRRPSSCCSSRPALFPLKRGKHVAGDELVAPHASAGSRPSCAPSGAGSRSRPTAAGSLRSCG